LSILAFNIDGSKNCAVCSSCANNGQLLIISVQFNPCTINAQIKHQDDSPTILKDFEYPVKYRLSIISVKIAVQCAVCSSCANNGQLLIISVQFNPCTINAQIKHQDDSPTILKDFEYPVKYKLSIISVKIAIWYSVLYIINHL
jgi:uncharacterized protein YfcZ (UPF0381/DUF406 family)